MLRSQGEEFALHLETAGVAVIATRYDGVMHEFFGAAAVLDQAQDAQLEAAMHLRTAFGTGSTFDPYPTCCRPRHAADMRPSQAIPSSRAATVTAGLSPW